MLVLARKPGEMIDITVGDIRITLTVIDIPRRDKVRIGFDAPQDVTLHRREVTERIEHSE